jgi:hypothetical protein
MFGGIPVDTLFVVSSARNQYHVRGRTEGSDRAAPRQCFGCHAVEKFSSRKPGETCLVLA